MFQDLPFQTPGMGSTGAFLAIVGFVALCVVQAAAASRRSLGADESAVRDGQVRAATAITVWLALTAALPASGLVGIGPPTFIGFLALSLGGAVGLALSPEGRRWAQGLPLWALVGFQAFRLPLEMVLHAWYAEGTVPIQMTWESYNIDVISGIVGLIAGLILVRTPSRPVAWGATAVGSLLLANVIVTAIRCSPMPVPGNFGADPILVLPLHAPYAWIVSICVAGALAGHIIAIRKLLAPS